MKMHYYYYGRDREQHGPAELEFLVREVKWGGLPECLMVRPEHGSEWIPLAQAIQGDTSVKLAMDVMSVTPEEVALLSRWKRLWYYYRRSWNMAFVLAGRASQRECLSVFLSMTLVDSLAFVVAPLLGGLVLKFLMPLEQVLDAVVLVALLLNAGLFLLMVLQSFSLCWRRLHDFSRAGAWIFVLPVVVLAVNGLVGWLWLSMDPWSFWIGIVGDPGIFWMLAFSLFSSMGTVLLLTWIVALLGLFPGTQGENRYGPLPEV